MTSEQSKQKREAYFYNTLSGLLNAFQSVFILMAITRAIGLDAAGVFTIAFAVANLLLTIGKYGIREFQVTDVKGKYSFADYLSHRLITTFIMMLFAFAYILYCATDCFSEKVLVTLGICAWKCIDSVEDVFQGELQRNGRLDLGAKAYTYRLVISILCYILLCVWLQDLVWVTYWTIIISALAAVILTRQSVAKLAFRFRGLTFSLEKNGKLLREGSPFFTASILSFYIINAPKYSIDRIMTLSDQARYGFISMPVFIIGLIGVFIYMPMVTDLAKVYHDKKNEAFFKSIFKIIGLIVLLTFLVCIATYFIGVPALSLLFHAELSDLRMNLCIIIFCSGLLAYTNFLLTIITIMRNSRIIFIAYFLAALFGFFFSDVFVLEGGVMGATWVLMLELTILSIPLSLLLGYKMVYLPR